MRFLFLLLSLGLSAGVIAQGKVRTFEFRKGEVLDIIFLNNKPDTDSLLREYFTRASPIAEKFTYQSLSGFPLRETPLRGNYHPDIMALGKWDGVNIREDAVAALETEMTGFHEMRRAIWSTFNMTYWEFEEDVTWIVDPDEYNVITSLWGNGAGDLPKYARDWLAAADKAGGQIRLQLAAGTSPFGYRYAPDLLVMIAWPSREAYTAFQETVPGFKAGPISHVNEFAIK